MGCLNAVNPILMSNTLRKSIDRENKGFRVGDENDEDDSYDDYID